MSTPPSVRTHARSIVAAVRGSALVFIVALGLLCLLLSVLLSTYVLTGVTHDVLAGFFAIWGGSALVYAAVGHIVLRLIGYH